MEGRDLMSYYLKKHWKPILLLLILTTVIQLMSAGFQLIGMRTFDALLASDLSGFLFWIAVEAAGWGLYWAVRALRDWSYYRTARKLNNAVRRDITATLMHKNYRDYHAQDKGEYLSWLTTGVAKIEANGWDNAFAVANSTARVVAAIAALGLIYWPFVPLSLLSAAVMIILPKLYSKRVTQLGEACVQGQEAAVSGLKDLLSGYDVLRFFGKSARFSGDMDTASDRMEKPAYEQGYKKSMIDSKIGFIMMITQLLPNVYCGIKIFQGVLSPAVLTASATLIGSVANGLNNLANQRLQVLTTKPYFNRITVHADELQPEPLQELEPVQKAIRVENVSFRYGEKPVLDSLTVNFEKGGKYALTGPSGCGKSTLLKLILGWLPDYDGSIRFDGRDATDYTPEQLQKQMSYIAQDVFLFNTTIHDNITLGETFTEEQLQKALQDSALAGDLANMPLGLDTPVGEEGSALSGGQKQRVAIARALIHDRSILLVDEGTSALDEKNAGIVEESLLGNPELTLILVSHHLSPERKARFDGIYHLEPVSAQNK